MNADNYQVILIVITLFVAGFSLYRSYKQGETITLTGAVGEIKNAQPDAVKLMEIAQIAVNAVEQLRREHKITSNDVAFNYALSYIKKWIPDGWEIDNEDIIAAINAAVLVASFMSDQIPPKKQEEEEEERAN